ncbi:MAG: CopD family protein [Deltaproteobacteria bacterium]|nr:CopD family protein [Deltaproteobacteria bacterium]
MLALWVKALHLIAMVAWFAGVFYMFRLLVYQAENKDSPDVNAVLVVMAYRLYAGITTPAMVATLFFGVGLLLVNPNYLMNIWLWAKLPFVVALIYWTLYIGRVRKRFEAGDIYLTPTQCRVRNEVPLIFLVAIILLAVLRPWGSL